MYYVSIYMYLINYSQRYFNNNYIIQKLTDVEKCLNKLTFPSLHFFPSFTLSKWIDNRLVSTVTLKQHREAHTRRKVMEMERKREGRNVTFSAEFYFPTDYTVILFGS